MGILELVSQDEKSIEQVQENHESLSKKSYGIWQASIQ